MGGVGGADGRRFLRLVGCSRWGAKELEASVFSQAGVGMTTLFGVVITR